MIAGGGFLLHTWALTPLEYRTIYSGKCIGVVRFDLETTPLQRGCDKVGRRDWVLVAETTTFMDMMSLYPENKVMPETD